jgi:hypothetical protein
LREHAFDAAHGLTQDGQALLDHRVAIEPIRDVGAVRRSATMRPCGPKMGNDTETMP